MSSKWQVKISQSRGAPYFFNPETKESIWTTPPDLTEEQAAALLSEAQAAKRSSGQVRASHLLVKHSGSRRPASWKDPNITRSKDEAIEILRGFQSEIGTSADKFGELASVHSDCSSHSSKGDLGWFGPGQMQKPFEEATFALKVGQISDVISTDSGKETNVYVHLNKAFAVHFCSLNSLILYSPPRARIGLSSTSFALGKLPLFALPGTPMSEVRVSRIFVHPIKSCRGISVDEARFTPEGLEYDRLWCIVDQDSTIITARESPKMVLITSEIRKDPTAPHGGLLSVSFPEESGCESFSIPLRPSQEQLEQWQRVPKVAMQGEPFGDGFVCEAVSGSRSVSAILSEYFGRPVNLVYKGAEIRTCETTETHPDLAATAVFQDCFPVMVLSEESTTRIEQEVRNHIGKQGVEERWRTDSLLIERFRPNIVFQGAGPFAEDGWKQIRFGDGPVINLVSKCNRCLLPNVDPVKGERDKAVPYKIIMKFRTGVDPVNKMKPCVGVNAVPLSEGEVRVGDVVHWE
ncbi:Rotamase-domain-containing protein [Mycena indigotica]|uniref:peptidylprolyl isomerase n=1 Tax=Mycena indigotica TaxID=2126181 RepID=A0A8H6SY26_9AGAR|nr:Rotamase-domain-containing protein [Mycena indigotica]KAF7307260.1 Rotamase-domain-containing protein [Mycena indigotica]